MPSWHAVDLYTGLGLSAAADVTCHVQDNLCLILLRENKRSTRSVFSQAQRNPSCDVSNLQLFIIFMILTLCYCNLDKCWFAGACLN